MGKRKYPKGRERAHPAEEVRDRKKALFLRHFRRLRGKQYLAAEHAGVHVNTVWEWRKQDAGFAAEYEHALERSTDELEVEAERRAMLKSGRHDNLLMFTLKGRRKKKFIDVLPKEDEKEKAAPPDLQHLTPEALEALARMENKPSH